MTKFPTILIFFYSLVSNLSGDEVTLSGGFTPYETYYVGAIDLSTGTSNVQIFHYLLNGPFGEEPYDPKIRFNAEFTIRIKSPELGFENLTTLLSIETENPIEMEYPIMLDNRDFNLNSSEILDIHGNSVDIKFSDPEMIELIEAENMASAVVTMGRLPDGIYEYSLTLKDFARINPDDGTNDDTFVQQDIIKTETINITTPTSLNLLYPGGALADSSQNIVYTPYPVFQWSTETCLACELFIRVAEFNPVLHSTLGEAIEDVTSLPMDQIAGWENIENGTSFQYPVIGSRELEAGKLYVWQIKKELPTTLGTDAYLSTISIFKIAEPATTNQEYNFATSTQLISSPILIALKDLLGEDTFDAFFGDNGEIANYIPSGTYRINNENTTASDILQILDQLQQGTISVVNLNVE